MDIRPPSVGVVPCVSEQPDKLQVTNKRANISVEKRFFASVGIELW